VRFSARLRHPLRLVGRLVKVNRKARNLWTAMQASLLEQGDHDVDDSCDADHCRDRKRSPGGESLERCRWIISD
jgi:hypothetical protein